MKLAGPLTAAAVILGANAVALIGVGRNRGGAPVETIQLTRRELSLNYHRQEDSGVSLRLNWNRFDPQVTSRLDPAKLGIDCAAVMSEAAHRAIQRPAFVVLEYDGEAWQRWLENARQQKTYTDTVVAEMSRLMPIDMGRTPGALLERYSNRQKYLIARGVIRIYATSVDAPAQTPCRLDASVSELLPENVHVPLPFSKSLVAPYMVTLGYGRRFEPWIVNISR
jgi:hypothetical protein